MQFIAQGYPAYAYTGGRPFDPRRPAVVMLHGAALDHSAWQWQSRYLAHHGFAVLAPDFPAHGRSPGTARGSVEAMAEWVAAFLDAATLGHAALVGHSLGALVALELALRHGARVAKLALVGPSVPMPVGEAFLAAARDDSPAAFDMETVWGHSRDALLAGSPVPGVRLAGATRQLIGRSAPGIQHADLAACNAYRASPEALGALQVPTLVVGGTRDLMTPLPAVRALAGSIPGARLLVLECGHAMPSEAPVALRRALADFLAQ